MKAAWWAYVCELLARRRVWRFTQAYWVSWAFHPCEVDQNDNQRVGGRRPELMMMRSCWVIFWVSWERVSEGDGKLVVATSGQVRPCTLVAWMSGVAPGWDQCEWAWLWCLPCMPRRPTCPSKKKLVGIGKTEDLTYAHPFWSFWTPA